MAVSNKARSTLTIGHAATAFDDPINGPRYDNERDKSRERERKREGGLSRCSRRAANWTFFVKKFRGCIHIEVHVNRPSL